MTTLNFRPPMDLSSNKWGKWSIDPIPPCVSICRPTSIPEAPQDTDMELVQEP